jgi:PAS domain-containing protein
MEIYWRGISCLDLSVSDGVSNATAGVGMMAAANPRRPDPMDASVPHHERARLPALHRNRILDTLPERDFDALAALAAQVCGTPMVLIGLIDATRHRIKRANQRAATLFGYPVDELTGRLVFDLYADTPHGKPRSMAGEETRIFLAALGDGRLRRLLDSYREGALENSPTS